MAVRRARKVTVEVKEVVEVQALRVGSEVIVNHVSNGEGKLVRVKDHVAEVTALYLDGSVRIGSGDVYKVEPAKNAKGRAKWQTVMPKKMEQNLSA